MKSVRSLISVMIQTLALSLPFGGGVEASAADLGEIVECVSVDGDTKLEILFRVEEDRYQAVWMVASDPTVAPENSEVARFDANDGLLSSSDTLVVAHVDLRNPKTGRKGERIGGTVLGALKVIMLDLDVGLFQMDLNAASAAVPSQFSAQATFFKRNGEQHLQDFDCLNRR